MGHIDEYISTISIAKDQNSESCGIAVVISDPLEGLNLLKEKLTSDSFTKNEAKFTVDDIMELDPEYPSIPMVKRRWELFQSNQFPKHNKNIEDLSTKISKSIHTEANKLVQLIKKKSNCTDVPVVTLPTLMSCPYYEASPTSVPTYCHNDLPNSANFISLGKDNIVADSFLEEFNSRIQKKFEKHGHQVHFIDSTIYHGGNGGPHCSTSVVREVNGNNL